MTEVRSRLVIEISAENARRNAEALGRELQNIERNGTYATTSMDNMSVAARKLAGHLTALVTIGSGIEKLDLYTNLENRLKLVTNSQIELNRATEDTFKIAQRTGSAWDSAAQVYQRFANNARTLGLNMQHTARLTETVSKAVAISGASTASADAALTQFGQALASGTLRGEELNSVMEQTPGLAQAIAEGMGITVGELRKVAATGAITSEALVRALDKAKDSVDNLFSKTDFTIGQSFTMLNNELTKFVGEAGKGSGATKAISESVQTLAKNLETVTDVLMIGGAYYAGTYIPAIYKAVAAQANKIQSTMASIKAEEDANALRLRTTQAELNAAQAEMTRARDAIVAAEEKVRAEQMKANAVIASAQAEVAAQREVIASKIAAKQATIAEIAAERAVAKQRIDSALSTADRTAAIAKNTELKQAQALATRQLNTLESKLASTTIENSPKVIAANQSVNAAKQAQVAVTNAQTASTERLTVATSECRVAQDALTGGQLRIRAMASGLLGVLGGPAGLAGMAVAVGASMLLMSSNTDEATQSLAEQKKTVGELADAYNKLSTAQLYEEQKKLQKEAEKAKDAMELALTSAQSIAPNVPTMGATPKEIQQNLDFKKTLDQIQQGTLSVVDAQRQMQKQGFSKDQINDAAEAFSRFSENKDNFHKLTIDLDMVNARIKTSNGLYDEGASQAENYRAEISRVDKAYDTSNTALLTFAQGLMDVSEHQGTSTKQLNTARDALEKYSKGQGKASDLAIIFNKNLKISPENTKTFVDQAKETDKLKTEQTNLNKQLEQTNKQQAEYEKHHQSYISQAQEKKEAIEQQTTAQQNLNKAMRESADKDIGKLNLQIRNEAYNGGSEHGQRWLKFLDKFKSDNKLDQSKVLTDDQKKIATELFLKQEQLYAVEQKNTTELDKQKKLREDAQKIAEKTIKSRTVDSVIGRGEGNYNSYNRGKAGDSTGNPLGLNLQNMTVAQVRALQKKGSVMAVGKYQTIPSTLQGAIDSGVIQQSERFTAELQERIVRQYLLTAKKGRNNIEDYIKGKSDNLTAANIDLSKEFASVENPLTGKSNYAGKGGNKASISAKQAQDALKASRELYAQAIASGKSAKQAWQEAFNSSISFVDGSQQQKDLLGYVKEFEDAEKKRIEIRKLYESKELKDLADHTQKLKDIQENFGDSNEGRKLTDAENNRFTSQQELTKLKREYDLKSFKMTEDQKLVYSIQIQQKDIEASTELNDTQKTEAIDALKYKFNYELTQIDLLKRERLLAAQEAAGKENEFIVARYKLERDKLKEVQGIDEDELQIRKALLEQQQSKTLGKDVEDNAKQWSSMKRGFTGISDGQFTSISDSTREKTKVNDDFKKSRLTFVDNDESQKTDDVQSLYDQQLISLQEFEDAKTEITQQAAEQRAQIEQDAQETQAQIDKDAQERTLQTKLMYGEQIFGSMTEMLKASGDDQSAIYKTMFATEKAFAIASAAVQIPDAISKALNNPYPLNLVAMANVASLGATVVSNISAVSAGFKTGGYTGDGGVNDVAGVVHGKEFVLTAEATQRVGVNALNAINNGADIRSAQQAQQTASVIKENGTNINIHNHANANVGAQRNSDGSVSIQVVEKMLKQSWSKLGDANSHESKQMSRNTGAGRIR